MDQKLSNQRINKKITEIIKTHLNDLGRCNVAPWLDWEKDELGIESREMRKLVLFIERERHGIRKV